MATVNIGRPPGSALTDTGTIGQDVMRASTYGRTTQHLWLRKIGIHAGKFGIGATNVDARLAAYTAASNGDPQQRLALVGLFTISSVMTSSSEGFDYERSIDVADDLSSNKGEPIPSGTRIALAVECDNAATLAHGMVQLANPAFPSGQDAIFRDKTGVATPPTTFGSFTPSTNGVMSMWAVCDTNDDPLVPINRTTTNIDTLTPTFAGDFRDLNGTYGPGNGGSDAGDLMHTYRIQVRRSSDNVVIWNPAPFVASSSERTADRFTRAYAGNTLVRSTAYEWRCLVTDSFGASSDWSSWLSFTISGQGTVTAQTTPSGKQDTLTPGPFTARWTHAGALAMTHARVLIETTTGKVYLDSGTIDVTDVASSASPGTLFTESFATMFPGKSMTSGDYTWRIQGRDSATNWSNFSSKISFSVDKAPDTPSSLRPDKTVTTTLPLLQFTMGDDDDTSGTGLAGTVEILDAAGTLLQTRSASFVSGEKWQYQTIGADVPSPAVYRWRAYGFDGFLYSGGVTSSAAAQRSVEASFTFATGPTLTLVSPLDASTVTTSTPTFSWTAATQTQWRLRIYENGQLMYRTNAGQWTANTQKTYQARAGFLHNGHVYRYELDVGDVNGLTTTASATFTVTFTPPADVAGFAILPVSIGTDPWPSAIRGDWEPSTDPAFVFYHVYRSDLSDPLFELTSPLDVAFLDFHPPSGVDLTYTLKVVTELDLEQISSAGVSAQERIDLGGVVLSSVVEPYTIRAYLYRVEERTFDLFGIESTYKRWGDNAPSTIRGRGRWREITVSALIADDAVADATQRRAELEAIALLPTNPGTNLDFDEVSTSGQTYCYRDERGVKLFVSIPAEGGLSIGDLRLGRASVSMTLRQEAYQESSVVVI